MFLSFQTFKFSGLVKMIVFLVLSQFESPRPPTRVLRGFLEGLGLEALCKRFVREEVDLAIMREIRTTVLGGLILIR